MNDACPTDILVIHNETLSATYSEIDAHGATIVNEHTFEILEDRTLAENPQFHLYLLKNLTEPSFTVLPFRELSADSAMFSVFSLRQRTYHSKSELDSTLNLIDGTPPDVDIGRPFTVEDIYFITASTGSVFYREPVEDK